jgi:hypothetical protein
MRMGKLLAEGCPVTSHFPEMLLPAQFLSDRLLVGQASGEMALRWAVFADGLKQYWKLAADQASHASEEFREEESWVLSEDGDWPFSFINLCDTFGLNSASVRATLLAWKNAHLSGTMPAQSHKKSLRVLS